MRKTICSFALIIFAVFAFAGCTTNAGKMQHKPEFKKEVKLTTVNKISMFSLVRKALNLYPDMERALSMPKESGLPDVCDAEIFVTIFNIGSPRVTGIGRDGCSQERILRAVADLTAQPNFKKFYLQKLDSAIVKVDILTRKQGVDFSGSLSDVKIEPGREGLILQDGERALYQLPSDYIYFGWEPDKKSGNLAEQRLKIQLKHLCRQAGLGEGAFKDYPIYEFRTVSYLQIAPDLVPLPLYRGNLLQSKIGAIDLARGAAMAGDWLITNVEPTGRFTYLFNPVTGEKSSFVKYNTIRHAGCVYALMHLYNQSLESRYLEKGRPALFFLQRHLKSPLLEPDLLGIKHPILGTFSLGAASLTLLALCELPDEQFADVGLERTTRLARFIRKLQLEDGRFYSVYLEKLAGITPDDRPSGFEGQALLALATYYNKNPNVDWLEAAKIAATSQIQSYEKTNRLNTWTLRGLVELYKIDPDPAYARVVFEAADNILPQQYTDPGNKDYMGAFRTSRPPKTIPTAKRAAALIAANDLCWYMGKECAEYEKAILDAARFILWNQYREDNTYFLGLPDKAIGAVRSGLADPQIRMDNNQHAIFALIGAYKIANKLEESKSISTENVGKGKTN